MSNTCRRIRSLQRVSFAYTFEEPARPEMAVSQATIVDVVGFEHSIENVRETTMQSWIQDPRVMGQRWTPVSVTPGSNWMQTDIIKNFLADCEGGRRVRVDWLWTGDASGSISKGGRPIRRHRDTGETSIPPPATPAANIPPTASPPVPIPLTPQPPPVIVTE